MSDIIGLIDGAIEDWTTSGDAMRWTPEARADQFVPHVNHPCTIMPATIETEGGGGYVFTLPAACQANLSEWPPWGVGDMLSFVVDLETGYCRPLREGEPVGSWLRIEMEDGSIAEFGRRP